MSTAKEDIQEAVIAAQEEREAETGLTLLGIANPGEVLRRLLEQAEKGQT